MFGCESITGSCEGVEAVSVDANLASQLQLRAIFTRETDCVLKLISCSVQRARSISLHHMHKYNRRLLFRKYDILRLYLGSEARGICRQCWKQFSLINCFHSCGTLYVCSS